MTRLSRQGRRQACLGRSRRTLLLLVALLVAVPVCAQPSASSVTEANGLVSVKAWESPLTAVVQELARRGLIELSGADRLAGPVSIALEAVPVDAVVSALLAEYRFDLTSRARPGDSRGPLLVVHILGRTADRAPVTGPIIIPALEAARAAEQDEGAADPDEAPDLEAAEDRAAEDAAQHAHLSELERAGAFAPTAPVESLVDLATDEAALVRVRALTALAARDERAALPVLVQALGDEDVTVRDRAVELLGAWADEASQARVGEVLVRGTDTSLRHGAFRVLALRASPTSVPLVEAVASDADATIKAAAATFLAEMARRAGGAGPTARRPSTPPL